MKFKLSPKGLAETSARHPWRTVGAWGAMLALSVVLIVVLLPSAMTTQSGFSNTPESRAGLKAKEDRLTGPTKDIEAVVIRSSSLTAKDEAFRGFVQGIESQIMALGPGIIDS